MFHVNGISQYARQSTAYVLVLSLDFSKYLGVEMLYPTIRTWDTCSTVNIDSGSNGVGENYNKYTEKYTNHECIVQQIFRK